MDRPIGIVSSTLEMKPCSPVNDFIFFSGSAAFFGGVTIENDYHLGAVKKLMSQLSIVEN
jgi:hypothetical protein